MKKIASFAKRFRVLIIILLFIAALSFCLPFGSLITLHLSVFNDDLDWKEAFTWLDRKNPVDRSEALSTAYIYAEESSGESYWDMIKQYPQESALYAGVLRYYLSSEKSGVVYQRPESRQSNKDSSTNLPAGLHETPAPEKAVKAIEMGRKLEPDNAFYDLCDAYLLFGRKLDGQAMAAIRKAGSKPKFDSHSSDILDANQKYGLRPASPGDWLHPYWRYEASSCNNLSFYLRLKDTCCLAMWMERKSRPEDVLDTTLDVERIGRMICENSNTVPEFLFGRTLQKISLSSAHSILQKKEPFITENPNNTSTQSDYKTFISDRVSELKSVSSRHLDPEDWKVLESDAESTDRVYYELRTKKVAATYSVMRVLGGQTFMLAVSGKLLNTALLSCMFWLLPALWLRIRKKYDVEDVDPSAVSIWLITVIISLPIVSLKNVLILLPTFYAVFAVWAMKIYIFIIPVVLIRAVWRTRIVPDLGRVDTFFARLRAGLNHAIKGLFILYILSIIPSIPTAVQANRVLDNWYNNELIYISKYVPNEKDLAYQKQLEEADASDLSK